MAKTLGGETGRCFWHINRRHRHGHGTAVFAQRPRLSGRTNAWLTRSIHVKEGLFDEAGNFGVGNKQFLQNWMGQYCAWVKKHVD